jgi:glucose dehydrogenase
VGRLQRAWTYHTGDVEARTGTQGSNPTTWGRGAAERAASARRDHHVLPTPHWARTAGAPRFWDDNRWPCQRPPWGTRNAIDLDEGAIAWSVPLGVVDALAAPGATGTPSLGGAIATTGGVVFIAGTNDSRFRAFAAYALPAP